MTVIARLKRFKCLSCEPPYCEHSSECSDAIQCWKSKAKDSEGFESVSRGCTTNPQQLQYCGPTGLITFPQSHQNQNKRHTGGQYAIDCCFGDYCNNGTFPVLPISYTAGSTVLQDGYSYITKLFVAVLGPMFLLGVMTVVIVKYMKRKQRKRILASRSVSFDLSGYPADALLQPSAPPICDTTLKEYLDQSMTSGSGFGLPLLMQRSLAKQISLVELIGKGKYGEVWRGIFQGDNVAVKIFLSKDEASWSRETEVYNVLTWSPYIVHYIGSDITSRNSCTQFWLVTHYHVFGSLYDYLNKKPLCYKEMLKICYSMICGIEHLHSEEFSSQSNKVAVAHRDIKSKNILVKSDGECAIADFGLAVTHVPQSGKTVIAPNPRVGTKRYMAPEVLNETINMNSFEAFRKADIYAVGLVLWELSWRTLSNGIVEEYKPPFFDCVPADPSFEEMRKVVYVEQRRPVVPNRWASDPIMSDMVKLMKECWHQNSSARLTALRVQKTVKKIRQHPNIQAEFSPL